MRYTIVPVAAFSLALCLSATPEALALQTYQNGVLVPCGSQGVLFTNLGAEPTGFDVGADWNGFCEIALAWTDASGQAQSVTLLATPFPDGGSGAFQPSGGASSSLAPGGTITWTTGASGGRPGLLNLQLERPPSAQVLPAAPAAHRPIGGSATLGSVGGKIGAFNLGANNGENVICGSGGTLYTNLTPAAIDFDLMVNNQSQLDFGNTSQTCNVSVSWTDRNGHPQAIALSAGLSEGALSTSLLKGGVISWTSSGAGQAQVAFTWQLERAVSLPGERANGGR